MCSAGSLCGVTVPFSGVQVRVPLNWREGAFVGLWDQGCPVSQGPASALESRVLCSPGSGLESPVSRGAASLAAALHAQLHLPRVPASEHSSSTGWNSASGSGGARGGPEHQSAAAGGEERRGIHCVWKELRGKSEREEEWQRAEEGARKGTPGKRISLSSGLWSPKPSLALWGCFLCLSSRYLAHCSSQDF